MTTTYQVKKRVIDINRFLIIQGVLVMKLTKRTQWLSISKNVYTLTSAT
ncbi:MAG: hypothetical protein OFPI_10610 [Osedax symbiont Rs2]|nr:MAG: hypothetical protein OFPI_10610 [Osedax symbiont Rs2]